MKRRHFLQLAASTLTTLGINQLQVQRQSLLYAKTLAKSTSRKLALLVGINGYEGNHQLKGCVTDANLQRELLIHRFGFHPQDILMVTDESQIKPIRENILQAFEQHLIQQAKADDVVVFHFSGHGSQVIDPDSTFSDQLSSSFVPIDRVVNVKLSSDPTQEDSYLVSDLTGRTFFLLISALKTPHFTGIFDSCHSGGGTRGNIRIRSLRLLASNQQYIGTEEQQYREKWLSQLPLTREEFQQEKIPPGVVLSAAKRNQLASDMTFEGFYAGAFTYTLTQYLWQETRDRALVQSFWKIAPKTSQIATQSQIPTYQTADNSHYTNQPLYLLNKLSPSADGVITQRSGKTVEIWLGGISAQTFPGFNQGAVFSLLDDNGQSRGLVKLHSREGLKAKGELLTDLANVSPGSLLREQARVIPKDFRLIIGVDKSLNVQAVQDTAQQWLFMERLRFILLGDQPVHYILSRITAQIKKQLPAVEEKDLPPLHSIGLFDASLDLVPNSFALPNEDLDTAFKRLRPKFLSLMAARLIKLVLNADSSPLRLSAVMKLGNQRIAASAFTVRGGKPSGVERSIERDFPLIEAGSKIQFEISNQEANDLYLTVLVINPEATITAIFPNDWTAQTEPPLIKAGQTRIIPETGKDPWQLIVGKPLGMVEVLIIASVTPMQEGLNALQTLARQTEQSRGPLRLGENSVTALEQLLLSLAVRSPSPQIQASPEAYAIHTSQLAALSLTFQSVL
ncbi:UNVERIFIED_CONTAM: hypothetical protein BEN50_03370 [Euhalothece sp. KZN 001]